MLYLVTTITLSCSRCGLVKWPLAQNFDEISVVELFQGDVKWNRNISAFRGVSRSIVVGTEKVAKETEQK